MSGKRNRLALLPVLVSNVFLTYGVLLLNWSVADIFFWFWCETVLTGATLVVVTPFRIREDGVVPALLLLLLALAPLFYASLFTAGTYLDEWKAWNRFPQFVTNKTVGVLAIVVSYAVYWAKIWLKLDYGVDQSRDVPRQLGKRSFVLSGLYLVLMVRYHLSGGNGAVSLKTMGVVLLAFKLVAECGGFDRFVQGPRKTTPSS